MLPHNPLSLNRTVVSTLLLTQLPLSLPQCLCLCLCLCLSASAASQQCPCPHHNSAVNMPSLDIFPLSRPNSRNSSFGDLIGMLLQSSYK